MPTDTPPSGKAQARDYDGLFKTVLEANPADTVRIFFGLETDGREVVLEGPTEQQRHLTRSRDKTYILRRDEEEQDRAEKDGLPVPMHEVCHIEIQVERVAGFQERMVSYRGSRD
ncbi:hypothetical protein BJ973_009540 [Actinoplanes tereljensis]|uniref:Uncharacterized protein n=1 Tax=Paractinoplanes tereljensis TaxID=571912 RepID=A0A919TQJ8_9ACTN|nr:hypothetical protein [Actinoplanes tereljensis]GIF17495.1 hypothetical protein Ate02nite_02250 [Actinoplanes tereljensis]